MRLSANEYEAIVEQSPILIWRADITTGCNYFNEQWLAFRGRTMEQEYGTGWAEGVHPGDFDRCLRIYRDAFARREIFEMEYRLMRHDGIFRWIFDRGVPYFSPDGEFAGYIGSCIDVTERVEAQRRELGEWQSLIPMCSTCKKIKSDQGDWLPLEEHLMNRAHMGVTHGMCPDCYRTAIDALGSVKK